MFAAHAIFQTAGANYDADALAWITAVETADAQALESGVKDAMNDKVLAYKAAGKWTGLITSVTLMGARTIAGAMVDMKDPSRSYVSNNFVSGDYNRTTGLLGNASNKYLDPGILDNNAGTTLDNFSVWTYASTISSGSGRFYCGSDISSNGGSGIRNDGGSNVRWYGRNNSSSNGAGDHSTGLLAVGRDNSSTTIKTRGNQTDADISQSSEAIANPVSIYVFTYNNNGVSGNPSNARIQSFGFGDYSAFATTETIEADFVAAITALAL